MDKILINIKDKTKAHIVVSLLKELPFIEFREIGKAKKTGKTSNFRELFGIWKGKPVFCLPGGPPSNEMAFLQLALPGVLRLAGWQGSPFPSLTARLTEPVKGRDIDWTQFKRGRLHRGTDEGFCVTPYLPRSRLESMALADCLIEVPEGVERLEAGEWVSVQMLSLPAAMLL